MTNALDEDQRKKEEVVFHDFLRSPDLRRNSQLWEYYHSNEKFYSVDRANRRACEEWLSTRCRGRRVLDYCCGEGYYSFVAARYGGYVSGVDISGVSIRRCITEAEEMGLTDRARFQVMDAENLGFRDGAFDVIICAGVLHHLSLPAAYRELARVLAAGGEVICMEPLRHNPVIQAYRRRTPHLRTAYEAEHIFRRRDIELARRYFGDVRVSCFHLATLLAVPLRNSRIFLPALSALECIDRLLLRVPIVKWQAWMSVFTLAGPVTGRTSDLPRAEAPLERPASSRIPPRSASPERRDSPQPRRPR